MRYLCLIVWDEDLLHSLPKAEIERLNAAHLALNEELVASGQFIEAEPLEPSTATTRVQVRQGKTALLDGPYVETKEQVAGFYLVEARDLNEAIQVAQRFPSAAYGTVEVRPCRQLVVDGQPRPSSSKSAATHSSAT